MNLIRDNSNITFYINGFKSTVVSGNLKVVNSIKIITINTITRKIIARKLSHLNCIYFFSPESCPSTHCYSRDASEHYRNSKGNYYVNNYAYWQEAL